MVSGSTKIKIKKKKEIYLNQKTGKFKKNKRNSASIEEVNMKNKLFFLKKVLPVLK